MGSEMCIRDSLYSQLTCSGKTATAHGTLTAGTIYKLQSSNTTVKFDQEQNQKTLLQEDNKYLTLGTVQKGKNRHKLLMDQQSTVDTGRGVKVSALRISGFQLKEEKPKHDTSELDEWAAMMIRKTQKGDKTKKQEDNPPKVKPKTITYPQVNIVTVSP